MTPQRCKRCNAEYEPYRSDWDLCPTCQEAVDLAVDAKRASRLNDRLTKQGFFPTHPRKGE